MTDTYLTNITPDSLSGILFALEGVENAIILLNGPSGCKFYHSATSDAQLDRNFTFDPLNFPEDFFFGQSRVPCTYLDKRDYVYGSEEKINKALSMFDAMAGCELIAIVNSPGAALIGDDLSAIVSSHYACNRTHPVILTFETPGFSEHIWDGYARSCDKLIEEIAKSDVVKPDANKMPSVNILGLSIFHKYCRGDLKELKRLLTLCGIDVICSLGSSCSVEDIRSMSNADLNIVVDPLYGLPSAMKAHSTFGTPYIALDSLPIGFSATEDMFRHICHSLTEEDQDQIDTSTTRTKRNPDIEPFLDDARRARAACYAQLMRVNSLTGLPKGTHFAVHGTASQCLGYCRFLMGYLGMVPDSVSVTDRKTEEPMNLSHDSYSDTDSLSALRDYLNSRSLGYALEHDISESSAEIVLADGNIIARLKARGHIFSGIEISLPTLGYIDVIPKTHLGNAGGTLLVEQILNGLMY